MKKLALTVVAVACLGLPEARAQIINDTLIFVVAPFEGLLVDRARDRGARALVRGLRQVSDFDFELRMAAANRRLAPDIETVFFPPAEQYAFVSSSLVREIHHWGGDVSGFVPAPVVDLLARRTETG